MSGVVLDIYSSLSLLLLLLNVHFLIMHKIGTKIGTRNKRYNTFKSNTLVKFNCQIFSCFQSVYSVCVGFVDNLLNRPTNGVTVRKSAFEKMRPKKSYFSSDWEYVKYHSKLLQENSCNS
jgi:hypothetical protein